MRRLIFAALLCLMPVAASAQSIASGLCDAPGWTLIRSSPFEFTSANPWAQIDLLIPAVQGTPGPVSLFAFAEAGVLNGVHGVLNERVTAAVAGITRRVIFGNKYDIIAVRLIDQLEAFGGIGDSYNILQAAVCYR